jgi:hypothetical protein
MRIPVSIGMGPNMIIVDIEAKKRLKELPWRFEEIPEKLWPIPLREFGDWVSGGREI